MTNDGNFVNNYSKNTKAGASQSAQKSKPEQFSKAKATKEETKEEEVVKVSQ